MKDFCRVGHLPTLLSSFLYFDFCFAIWVLNGAMAPYISEEFGLTPAQKGFMVSVPIISGALLRFPLGLLAQYIGRKKAALIEMAVISIALLYGWMFADTYTEVLIMGVLLGIAGASFGVALSLGAGWYPAKYKGFAMGIAGAGNSGTIIATLFAPPLAEKFGWQQVFGFAIIPMLIAIIILSVFAKEPPDREQKKLGDYLKVLFEKDAWVFNLMYIVTFGGFIGLTNFMPTFFHDQFGVTKIQAGRFTTMVVLMGSAARVLGGYFADTLGGIRVLKIVFVLIAAGITLCSFSPGILGTILLLLLVFACLGAGNGCVFQLVPLRFQGMTAIASSLIGEVGALGGALIPNMMGISQHFTKSFSFGFFGFAIIVTIAFFLLWVSVNNWIGIWLDGKGKAIPLQTGRVVMAPVIPAMEIY